jgi:hypothetical protein
MKREAAGRGVAGTFAREAAAGRGMPRRHEEKSGVMDLRLIDFDSPSQIREFEKGRFDVYQVGPMTLGRATYEPGWKWSEHVGATRGERFCQIEHVGLVLAGQAVVSMADGREVVVQAGQLFYIPPGHDSWVVGDDPYVSLHVMGGEDYAA